MKYVIQQSVFVSGDYVQIAPFAQVTITNASDGSAASLWNDIDGLDPVTGNVILADADGFFRVYVDQGRYDIEILSDGTTQSIVDFLVVGDTTYSGIYRGADFPAGVSAPAILFKFTDGVLTDIISREV